MPLKKLPPVISDPDSGRLGNRSANARQQEQKAHVRNLRFYINEASPTCAGMQLSQ
jgi:hypothetical protein